MNIDVRCEHRNRWEVESMIRILEGHFDISAFNVYHPQEGFSGRRVGDVTNQYSTKVEEYERTDAAALDCLYHQEVSDWTTEAGDSTRDKETHRHPFAGMPIPHDESILLFAPVGPRRPIFCIIIRSEVLE